MKYPNKFFLILFCVLFFLNVHSVHAENLNAAQELITRAKSLSLSSSPQWLAFLHYDKTFPLFHNTSRSVDKAFFLSKDGATDPQAELEATINAFFLDPSSGDDHAICKFPARFEWLVDSLQVSKDIFPHLACERLHAWFSAVEAEHVTIIYPSSFLNNPASAFGHTFLRLDQKNQTEETRLLAYAADFSASTNGENALIYAVKGIFGGFDGFYTVSPYYKKVTQYSDLENRDIWEYQLSFNQSEVRRLTLHLWELREHAFTYFYFDENCSYHILGLLQVARPSMNLLAGLRNWAIPVDTVKVVLKENGILNSAVFRPSAATKLRSRIKSNDDETQIMALRLAQSNDPKAVVASDDFKKLLKEAQSQAVDIAYEDRTYETIRSHSDSPEDKKIAWDLLSLRSQFASPRVQEVETPLVRPDQGHKTAMFSVGAGRSSDRTIGEIAFRPAFHSVTDPQDGFLPGSQIKFFETTVRQTEQEGFSLQQFTALDIQALTPRERFFLPLSWNVRVEAKRVQRKDGNDPLLAALTAGAGHSYDLGSTVLAYGFLQGSIEASGGLESSNAAGLGPKLGIIFNPTNSFGTELSYSDYRFISGDTHTEQTAMLTERFSFSQDTSLRVDLSHQTQYDTSFWSGMIRVETYFTP